MRHKTGEISFHAAKDNKIGERKKKERGRETDKEGEKQRKKDRKIKREKGNKCYTANGRSFRVNKEMDQNRRIKNEREGEREWER